MPRLETNEQYNEALREIAEISADNPSPKTKRGQRLLQLVRLTEKYENDHHPLLPDQAQALETDAEEAEEGEEPQKGTAISADTVAEFLFTTGLLFEINRLVLHPRGLTLAVEEAVLSGLQRSLTSYQISCIWDCQKIRPEGNWYTKQAFERGNTKLKSFDETSNQPEREQIRKKALGFIQQT